MLRHISGTQAMILPRLADGGDFIQGMNPGPWAREEMLLVGCFSADRRPSAVDGGFQGWPDRAPKKLRNFDCKRVHLTLLI